MNFSRVGPVLRQRLFSQMDAHQEGFCPVCLHAGGYAFSSMPERNRDAAHCCLWPAFSHDEREKIADRVTSGATWMAAIKEFDR